MIKLDKLSVGHETQSVVARGCHVCCVDVSCIRFIFKMCGQAVDMLATCLPYSYCMARVIILISLVLRSPYYI